MRWGPVCYRFFAVKFSIPPPTPHLLIKPPILLKFLPSSPDHSTPTTKIPLVFLIPQFTRTQSTTTTHHRHHPHHYHHYHQHIKPYRFHHHLLKPHQHYIPHHTNNIWPFQHQLWDLPFQNSAQQRNKAPHSLTHHNINTLCDIKPHLLYPVPGHRHYPQTTCRIHNPTMFNASANLILISANLTLISASLKLKSARVQFKNVNLNVKCGRISSASKRWRRSWMRRGYWCYGEWGSLYFVLCWAKVWSDRYQDWRWNGRLLVVQRVVWFWRGLLRCGLKRYG